MDAKTQLLPVIPLREYTLEPGVVVPLFVARPASIAAIRHALAEGTELFAVTQKGTDVPAQLDDFRPIGTVAEVRVMMELPDGALKVQLNGLRLGRLVEIVESPKFLCGRVAMVLSASVDDMGRRPPTQSSRDAPDEIVETIPLEGFDPEGEPELRRERSGNLWLVFNAMPPSWVPEVERKDFGRCARFDQDLRDAIDSPVLWDDREFFLIEQPKTDCVDRIKRFLSDFRAANESKS
jgi:ATP-dependent protease La (LON) substrate-binding domain